MRLLEWQLLYMALLQFWHHTVLLYGQDEKSQLLYVIISILPSHIFSYIAFFPFFNIPVSTIAQ